MSQCRDGYKLTPIAEAVASAEGMALIKKKLNLIGVVLFTSFPKKTKDYFCLVKIVDESYPSPGLSVNFFTETMDKLPLVLNAGDIIQISHVTMRVYESEAFAVFNKKYSSFALFQGKHSSTSFSPYQWSYHYHARDQDNNFIFGLRNWLVNCHVAAGANDFQSLKDVTEGEGFNLICKIVHVCEIEKDKLMLLVWDGTDTPPANISTTLEDEIENPLPLHSVSFCLPRDVLCSLPRTGTVLRVTQDHVEKLEMSLLPINRWVKLINLKCELHASLWHAFLLPCTRFCNLPDEDDIVLQRTRD